MNGKTHLLTGLASGGLVAQYMGISPWIGAAVGGVGALLPDIDHPQALISSFIPGGFIVSWFMGGHRGITHSLLATGLVLFAAWALVDKFTLDDALALCFSIGYLAHLVGDMMTPSGVPLLFPAPFKFKVAPYAVLSLVAPLLEWIVGIISALLVVYIAAVALGWSGQLPIVLPTIR